MDDEEVPNEVNLLFQWLTEENVHLLENKHYEMIIEKMREARTQFEAGIKPTKSEGNAQEILARIMPKAVVAAKPKMNRRGL